MEPTAEKKFIDRIREYIKYRKYISYEALKEYLSQYGVVNENTMKNALYRLKDDGEIHEAGKGYYSTINEVVELDEQPVMDIKLYLKNNLPHLDFYLWGIEQIKYAFQHLITTPIYFVYSDKDNLSSIKNVLYGLDVDFDIFENPTTKIELNKYVNIVKESG